DVQRVELNPLRIAERYSGEIADRSAQRVHAWDDPELREQRQRQHQANEDVAHREDVGGPLREIAVEQRRDQEDDPGEDGDPMQLAERASDDVAGGMGAGQNLK